MSFDYSQEVIGDLEKVLETNDGYDVIIYAGENKNVKELRAHSSILCIRSKYFCTAFSKVWANKKDGKFIFEKPNISPQIFKIILRFIYCGRIDLTKLLGPEILELLMALDELNFHSLIPHVQEYLIYHQDEFLQQNPIEILETVYQHESFTDLWNYCLEMICDEPEMLFNSDNFINLKAPLLKLILKRYDLVLDEIEIWNNLLKWGIAKNPSISQDITKWRKEDITIIERSLHGFIPLIRFYHISSDDFLDKIYPLKELLPKDYADELVKFNIAPNRKQNIDEIQPPRISKPICDYDSILIKNHHFAVFASWIDKKNNLRYNVRNIPYKFNLLYRASRDGNAPAAFHAKCDNKGATIVIAKIKNSEQIVGGYNPLQWDSSGLWHSTFDSFIYFFADVKNIVTAKVSYSNGNKYSIGNNPSYAPLFGGGWDLYHDGNGVWHSNNNRNNSYPRIDGMPRREFNVNDCEIFQVIKK
ncbi:hypothetical protein GLOIN_2v1483637 [Rhizophagus irregularis DAOM 181602=DAOM 197198]|uniref:Btb/poz domain-containing protein 19-like n=1 Tax=Rhizophagus irregularis (strain DAOM 181602 / DAOM 197198 / MUCL 43194) TaxID=747089 RepID=A0A2P4PH57_RHIID|nr:hypothetical protein GLOIN_2v1483637 [Rhizophagus irregularis DAOM 181602=DAOM 197198]POG64722.1 hypothetical protein GLOIN_2v1483637 [Rhizophagus irregularis DAOM 181602=DAOM 197198]|eukprot:XP_025171588.1 hypothetical protein GLOIN_2v1483637 [Rhizophagus irregularis DAOM 181602=DAOM 197198]